MKNQLLFIISLVSLPLLVQAQFKLDVDGSARIIGQLDLNLSGNSVLIGTNTGQAITTGTNNVFIGYLSGQSNTGGSNNVFSGRLAGVSNTLGNFNTFLGSNAGRFNDTGVDNVFVGGNSGWSNTMGNQNTFAGRDAGFGNTTGSHNTFLGQASGIANTSGNNNTFVGSLAGATNSIGIDNTFVGYSSGLKNTSGSLNVFLGTSAGEDNTTGADNTFMGVLAGNSNTSGRFNTFMGEVAGASNTTGNSNTFIGLSAGSLNITGNFRTGIGQSANSEGADYDNSTGLGYDADPTGANIIHVGNTSVTSIKGQVGFTTYSDGRFKKEIQRDEVPGLAFIRELEPVTYRVSVDAFAQWKEGAYGTKDTLDWEGKYDVEQLLFTGFIAQEVEAAAQKIGYQFSGVDKPANEKSFYGLRYATFVVPLVQGMQEQQEVIDHQQQDIDDLRSENDQLRNRLTDLEDLVAELVGAKKSEEQSARLSSVRLDQNEPNPFTGATRISYFLPADISGQAELVVTNTEGREIKRIILHKTGESYVEIEASQLASGNYQYALIIGGRIIATKRMVRVK